MEHVSDYNSNHPPGEQPLPTGTNANCPPVDLGQPPPGDEVLQSPAPAAGSPPHPSDDPDWTPRVTQLPARADLASLYEKGAHFLPVWGKGQPADAGWQNHRSTPAEVLAHLTNDPDRWGRNPQLGMKPMGLTMALVDIDAKLPDALGRLTTETVRSCGDPVLVVSSRKPLGRHLYYYPASQAAKLTPIDAIRHT